MDVNMRHNELKKDSILYVITIFLSFKKFETPLLAVTKKRDEV